MVKKTKDSYEKQIILYLIPGDLYGVYNLKILKDYVNKKKNHCVYVSLNNSYEVLIKKFKSSGLSLDKIFIIDAITSSFKERMVDNGVYIGNPRALTDISIAITSAFKALDQEKKVLFLDSMATLEVYNDLGTLTKFSTFVMNKMRELKINVAIISLKKDQDKDFIESLMQSVDKVVRV